MFSNLKKPSNIIYPSRVPFENFLKLLRWSIVFGCGIFVLRGFVYSYQKYALKKTSVSLTKNETKVHTYPSVTICHVMSGKKNVVSDLLNEDIMKEFRNKGTDTSVLLSEITKWGWTLQDLLQVFSHDQYWGPKAGVGVLTNESYWKVSVPHVVESGICFTYDPPFQSEAGWWYGIRIGIKLPDTEDGAEMWIKEDKLSDLRIYFHELGKFTLHNLSEDYPDSYILDMSWLRYQKENLVRLSYVKSSSLSSLERPCVDDSEYNFKHCVEEFYSRQRGCQPPWNLLPSLLNEIPPCNNLTEIREWFSKGKKPGDKGWDYYQWFTNALSENQRKTGCLLPCTVAIFKFESTDGDSDWVVHLSFDSFVFSYESEFLICDWTCLLGEIGGNLGFFLGGSVLGFVDLIIGCWSHKKSK